MKKELFTCPVISVKQPIGTFYVTSMLASNLSRITEYDKRFLLDPEDTRAQGGDDLDQYIGIQRGISQKRVIDISKYVQTIDATFPTSIVIAIQDDRSIEFSDDRNRLTFFSVTEDEYGKAVTEDKLARILDGQHRLAGIEEAGIDLELSVTVFPSLDIADQAYVFSTVNLAQTKVNKSLVYDLFDYARSRSPQKTSHNVATTLNRASKSPFFERIKRLGTATPGLFEETLTQATFVNGLIGLISSDTVGDRDAILRSKPLKRANINEFQKTPFRNLFIDERDDVIVQAVWNYFESVKNRWEGAWSDDEGQILIRTNGFRAFSSIMGRCYIAVGGNDKYLPKAEEYLPIWDNVHLADADFNKKRFLPGTSGERALYKLLDGALRIFTTRNPR